VKDKILHILESMSTNILELKNISAVLLKDKVTIDCNSCGKKVEISTEAVYKQRLRGKEKYTCKSCAGKQGWTEEKRENARKKAIEQWHDPDYAGGIVGKAIAREVIEQSRLDNDI
jgi:transposase-like protein